MFTLAKLLFRLTPWWLFALLGVMILPSSFSVLETALPKRAALLQAASASAPRPVDADLFTPESHVHPVDEVAISGVVPVMALPAEDADGPMSQVYISQDGTKAYVAKPKAGSASDASRRASAGAELRGIWRSAPRSRSLIRRATEALAGKGVAVQQIYVIETFDGPRADRLRESARFEEIFLSVTLGFNALLLVVAWVKRRAARRNPARRVIQKRAKVPSEQSPPTLFDASKPDQDVPETRARRKVGGPSKRLNDGFDDSPIKHVARWRLF